MCSLRRLVLAGCLMTGFFPAAAPAAGTVAAPPAAPLTQQGVAGIYLLNPVDKPTPRRVLTLRDVSGISLRVGWETIEPAENDFAGLDSYLDREIAKAREAAKTVTLRVMPGTHTPDWVFARGATAFTYVDRNPRHGKKKGGREATFGRELRIPVPWDEAFLSMWKRLIAVLGERYREESSLVMIHVTGPNRNSAEMHLPHGPEDKAHWQEIGYTPEKVVGAWQQCLEAWAAAFPHAFLTLDLSPVIYDDGVMEAVARYGYEKLGSRLLLQNNALTSDFTQSRPDFRIIAEYADKTMVGFQMLGMATAKADARQGDLKVSLDHGLALGATYFEIYPRDAERLPEVIRYGMEQVRRKADTVKARERPSGTKEVIPQDKND